jgi:hypothetical protein
MRFNQWNRNAGDVNNFYGTGELLNPTNQRLAVAAALAVLGLHLAKWSTGIDLNGETPSVVAATTVLIDRLLRAVGWDGECGG